MLGNSEKFNPCIVSLSLLMICGCSLPLWQKDEAPLHSADTVSQWQGAPQQGPGGPGAHPDPAMPLHQPRPLPMNEQISQMSQRLASADDDRKVLASRLHMVETQLEEKEKALAVAMREIQDATAQVVRTRNDLQQWKKDTKALRDNLGNLEKDNRETMETMIKTLEQVLERDRDTSKGPGLPPPDVLPLPKRT
jgi:hypothetical protein